MLDTEKTVIEALRGEKHITARDICELTGMSRGTVGSILTRLKKKKLVFESTIENPHPGPHRHVSGFRLTENPAALVKAEKNGNRKRNTATRAQVDQLKQEIEKLSQWKDWAISIHPDLGADPLVIKARLIFASKLGLESEREHVMSGARDLEPSIQALLEVLKAA